MQTLVNHLHKIGIYIYMMIYKLLVWYIINNSRSQCDQVNGWGDWSVCQWLNDLEVSVTLSRANALPLSDERLYVLISDAILLPSALSLWTCKLFVEHRCTPAYRSTVRYIVITAVRTISLLKPVDFHCNINQIHYVFVI